MIIACIHHCRSMGQKYLSGFEASFKHGQSGTVAKTPSRIRREALVLHELASSEVNKRQPRRMQCEKGGATAGICGNLTPKKLLDKKKEEECRPCN